MCRMRDANMCSRTERGAVKGGGEETDIYDTVPLLFSHWCLGSVRNPCLVREVNSSSFGKLWKEEETEREAVMTRKRQRQSEREREKLRGRKEETE